MYLTAWRRPIIDITEKEIYNVSNIKNFKDTTSEFIIYGEIQLDEEIRKTPMFGKERKITRMKNMDKLKIRKNFKDEDTIRKLLQEALVLHQKP